MDRKMTEVFRGSISPYLKMKNTDSRRYFSFFYFLNIVFCISNRFVRKEILDGAP